MAHRYKCRWCKIDGYVSMADEVPRACPNCGAPRDWNELSTTNQVQTRTKKAPADDPLWLVIYAWPENAEVVVVEAPTAADAFPVAREVIGTSYTKTGIPNPFLDNNFECRTVKISSLKHGMHLTWEGRMPESDHG